MLVEAAVTVCAVTSICAVYYIINTMCLSGTRVECRVKHSGQEYSTHHNMYQLLTAKDGYIEAM